MTPRVAKIVPSDSTLIQLGRNADTAQLQIALYVRDKEQKKIASAANLDSLLNLTFLVRELAGKIAKKTHTIMLREKLASCALLDSTSIEVPKNVLFAQIIAQHAQHLMVS